MNIRELSLNQIGQGFIQGGVISVGLLYFVDITRKWLVSEFSDSPLAIKFIEFVTKNKTDGYLITEPDKMAQLVAQLAPGHLHLTEKIPQLAPGHLTQIAFALVELSVYGAIFFFFQPPKLPNISASEQKNKKNKSTRLESAALFYLLLIFSIFALLLGTLSFYFDYYRFSLLAFFVLIFAFTYWFFSVDHFYQLYPDQFCLDKTSCKKLGDFKEVLNKRLELQTNEKTLVVVCASGGGIQAAGWTAQVLTGLHELLGNSFTQSIGLISSVSGGSVGSMYYLDRIEDIKCRIERENIFNSATADSLDATGWGLAYPDLWRTISLPWLAPKMLDRGIALERDWQQEMKDPTTLTTLATWREKIFDGKIPIPIFNATLVENGKRFAISPMNFKGSLNNLEDFNSLYGGYDIPVVTAARLSATFPYVSPICRNTSHVISSENNILSGFPICSNLLHELENCCQKRPNRVRKEIKQIYHIADGGFYDNSGFGTILDWLNKWLDKLAPKEKLNLKRVIVLQINPFPQCPQKDEVKGDGGWFMATIGPLLAMYKVRDPILGQRNATEIEILTERWKGQVEIDYYPIYFPESNSSKDISAFYEGQKGQEKRYQPPLSWSLTQKEKQAIKDAWKLILEKIESNGSNNTKDPNQQIKEKIQELRKLWDEVKKEQPNLAQLDSQTQCFKDTKIAVAIN